MSINAAKTILGGLLPFAANPVVLTVIGIGAATWAVSSLFDDKEEQSEEDNQAGTVPNGDEPLSEPHNQAYSTAPSTVNKPLGTVEATVNETVETTAQEPFTADGYGDSNDNSGKPDLISDEDAKKEMIRQAMSELGKRSAAARAQKKSLR